MLAVSIAGSLLTVALVGGVAAGLERGPLPAVGQVASPHADKIESVIAAAQQYVGLPYRLGATGPDQFDCSGLVFRAFADAGQLSRIGGKRMRAIGYQRWFAAREGFFTEQEEAERGDLVMYGDGSHIGFYLGDGKVLSAVRPGVVIHRLHGLTVPATGFLRVDWSGEGSGGRGDDGPADAPAADDPVEEPPGLVPPISWLPPLAEEVALSSLPAELERSDMRTANSRTFERPGGGFTTELFSRPIFYQPADATEWQPIDLRFVAGEGRPSTARVHTSPVTMALARAATEDGFLELAAGGQLIRLAVPPGDTARRVNAAPEIGAGGAHVDYVDFLRGGVGLRVFAQTDGVKAFLVLRERPRTNEFSFLLDAPGLSALTDAGGAINLLDAEGALVARVPAPLTLDSSDVDGSGGGVSPSATSLGLDEEGEVPALTLVVDERYLAEAVYPVYVDLTINGFGPAALGGGATFVSSRHGDANFADYRRPETGHRELLHGRQPGTRNYSAAYLQFGALGDTLGGVDLATASLRVLPYWQHDDNERPTWIARVAEAWDPAAITWNARPATDADLGRFASVAGEWSTFDVTDYVASVLTGEAADHGLVLHANDIGRRGWKRILAGTDSVAAELEPRLVVDWSGLRPRPVEPDAGEAAAGLLQWAHPAVAPPQTRFRVEVSTDGFRSVIVESGVVRGRAGGENSWLVPAGELPPGSYAWRVRARYGTGLPWSDWSEPATFVVRDIGSGPLE